MVLIIRSNGVKNDPRVEKYLNFLKAKGGEYHILGWDRKNEKLSLENCTYYNRNSGYNVGGLKAAWNRLLWMCFCLRQIIRIRPTFIHGCDLDSTFPAVIYKSLFNNKVRVLFDVFDWFSATLSNQSKVIRWCFNWMESVSTKRSDYVFICEEERKEQIPYDISSKLYVLPNIPLIGNENSFKFNDNNLKFSNDKLVLSYVGGLYNERFLDELLQLASDGLINLLIAGYGDKGLEEKCYRVSQQDNVKYFGPVLYENGLHISYNSDIVYAMYCKSNPNHIYAAPNKYYETMLLGKPIITTDGTIVGDKVVKHNIGYVIEEDIIDLTNLIKKLKNNREDLRQKGEKAYNLWLHQYKDYTSSFLETTYYNLIISQ